MGVDKHVSLPCPEGRQKKAISKRSIVRSEDRGSNEMVGAALRAPRCEHTASGERKHNPPARCSRRWARLERAAWRRRGVRRTRSARDDATKFREVGVASPQIAPPHARVVMSSEEANATLRALLSGMGGGQPAGSLPASLANLSLNASRPLPAMPTQPNQALPGMPPPLPSGAFDCATLEARASQPSRPPQQPALLPGGGGALPPGLMGLGAAPVQQPAVDPLRALGLGAAAPPGSLPGHARFGPSRSARPPRFRRPSRPARHARRCLWRPSHHHRTAATAATSNQPRWDQPRHPAAPAGRRRRLLAPAAHAAAARQRPALGSSATHGPAAAVIGGSSSLHSLGAAAATRTRTCAPSSAAASSPARRTDAAATEPDARKGARAGEARTG